MAMTEQEIMEVMPKKPAAKLEVGEIGRAHV